MSSEEQDSFAEAMKHMDGMSSKLMKARKALEAERYAKDG